MVRFTEAFNLLEMYGEAKVVITQRIHAALPCVGMGVPVIFFNSPGMPGDEGKNKVPSTRTVGLTTLFHTLEMYGMSKRLARE